MIPAIATGLKLAVLAVGGLAVLLSVGVADEPVVRPNAPASPAAVLAEHDCWNGKAPADVGIPPAVVVQYADGTTTYSRELVGAALDYLFGGSESVDFDVIAFCR